MKSMDKEIDSYILPSTEDKDKNDMESCNSYEITPIRWILTGGEDGIIRKYEFISFYNGDSYLSSNQRHGLLDSIQKAGSVVSAWENEGCLPIHSIDVHSEAVWCLTGSKNGSINLWTLRQEEGTLVHTFKGHQGPVSCLKICPGEKRFLSGSWDKTIKLWSLDDGNVLHEFNTLKSQLTSIHVLKINPKNGNEFSFYATTFDGSLVLYSWKNFKAPIIINPTAPSAWCLSACHSSDGKKIYCARKNETVDEINAEKGIIEKTIRLPKDSGWVTHVNIMPNNRHLIICSNDNTRLWDLDPPTLTPSEDIESSGESHSKIKKDFPLDPLDLVPFSILSGHQGGSICCSLINSEYNVLLTAGGSRGWEMGGSTFPFCLLYDVSPIYL